MPKLNNSKLLDQALSRAAELKNASSSATMRLEFVLVAVIDLINEGSTSAEDSAELNRAKEYFNRFNCPIADARAALMAALEKAGSPITDPVLYQKALFIAQDLANSQKQQSVSLDLLMESIIKAPTSSIAKLISDGNKAVAPEQPSPKIPGIPGYAKPSAPAEAQPAPAPAPVEQPVLEPNSPKAIAELIMRTNKLRDRLSQSVFGQSHAVNTLTAGYFQSELMAMTDETRYRPRSTFLFAGPPGVGKTFMAEQTAKELGLPFERFDMSEYSDHNAVSALCGSDKNYVASAEGLLTGFVAKNPKCVLLFDEIEKAHLSAIHLFLQILDAGRLKDNRTNQEVPFKDAIIIFTTNAGRKLYEGSETDNLSGISRKSIISALRSEINPATREPFFPAAICSRFASGNVLMFNHLGAQDLRTIVKKQFEHHMEDLERTMGLKTECSEDLFTALLLAEGASADARTVKNRSDAFFGTEFYELYRLIAEKKPDLLGAELKGVRFTVDLPEGSPEICKLFMPAEKPEILVFADRSFKGAKQLEKMCNISFAATIEEARKLVKTHSFTLIACDVTAGIRPDAENYLNVEDIEGAGRDFLLAALEEFSDIPLFVLPGDRPLTNEERYSYMVRGARGFIGDSSSTPEDIGKAFDGILDRIHQQHNLTELARANKLVHFETAQSITDDGHAEITLFDFSLETAVDAEDSANILSNLSKPDTRFDQVIGAEDAKAELKHFVSYLKNPRKFMSSGVSMPKGIILYGPPGTGKTMLAKALAGESGVTYIAAEGNQFFKKYVGEGEEMVHNLFATARKYAPAILFIDEIDAIAKERKGGGDGMSSSSESILTAFLAEMDGFKNDINRPVFVLAATNFDVTPGSPKSLDAALMRRFDRRILVDLPDKNDRLTFLKQALAANPLFKVSEDTVKSIAERSTGTSLALLKSVINLAIRNCMRAGSDSIDDKAFEEAFETFSYGEKRAWDPEQTLRTARHEAGHTLMNWLAGEKPSYVTIVSRGNHGGYMQHENSEDKLLYTRAELIGNIRCSLGGRAAEIVYYGEEDGVSTGASGDLANATSVATGILCRYGMDSEFGLSVLQPGSETAQSLLRPAINRILSEQLDEAIRLIHLHRGKIDALVDALMDRSHLNAVEIDKILSEN